MSNLSHQSDIDWRTHQSRSLIVGCPKQIAADTGYCRDTIYRLARADYKASVEAAFAISDAQNNWQYLQDYAEWHHALLLPCPLIAPKRPLILILGDLTMNIIPVMDLLHKVARGEPLTDEQQRQLEEQSATIKTALDQGIEKSREVRREQEHGK